MILCLMVVTYRFLCIWYIWDQLVAVLSWLLWSVFSLASKNRTYTHPLTYNFGLIIIASGDYTGNFGPIKTSVWALTETLIVIAVLIVVLFRMVMEMYGKGSKSHRAGEILGYWKTLLKAGFNPGPMYKDELSRIYSEYAAVKHTNQLDPKVSFAPLRITFSNLLHLFHQLINWRQFN